MMDKQEFLPLHWKMRENEDSPAGGGFGHTHIYGMTKLRLVGYV